MMEIGKEEGYETGRQDGLKTGRRESLEADIQGTISIMKNMKLSNDDIIKQLTAVYNITENETMSYIHQI